jgi:hypothetical protein
MDKHLAGAFASDEFEEHNLESEKANLTEVGTICTGRVDRSKSNPLLSRIRIYEVKVT